MVLTIALLLFFQLAGTAIVTVTGLPIPGPVMGMLLFLFALMVKDNLLQQTLAHFSLLFVPAGVGIMQHGARLAAEWLPIAASIVISTLLAMAATAITVRIVMKVMKIQG